MAETIKMLINGEWVESSSGEYFDSINPATGEVVARVPRATREDADRAVRAAYEAQKKWRRVPAPHRAEVLFRVARILEQRKEELARKLTQEMGKVIAEARGDLQEAIDMSYFAAGEGRRMHGMTAPVEMPNKFTMSVRDPVGVVAVITPWNFPTAIPSWKMMPALVAGNAVVFKPASDTPLLAYELVRALNDAGAPPGVVNIIYGSGSVVGDALLEHPLVNLVTFTGSSDVGRHVAEVAGRHLKRVSLELGGKNAITIMDDADLDLAVEGVLWSAFGTTGQRCTACSRVIVHEKVKKAFLDRLIPRVEALRLGNGLDPNTDVGPLVNASQLKTVDEYVQIGIKEGAKLLTGGHPVTDGELARGFFYAPTVFETTPDMRIAQEEIFGPVLSVITVKDLDEAIEVNNGVAYGLSSSIYTQDINKAFKAMRDLTTGIVYVNAGTIGAEIHMPFGGTRNTGNGHREAGHTLLDNVTEWKTIYVDFSGRLQKAQIDNPVSTL